ncbi:MAG: hypothetical protein IJ629_03945 [Clostridia bacterium]|nr:hypothetical protein [Clostridia bacterium]
MEKIAQPRSRFLKVGAMFLTLVVISTMLAATAFADENTTLIQEVVINQWSSNNAIKPIPHVQENGFNIVYVEESTDDSNGTTVYWWKYNLETNGNNVFGAESKAVTTGPKIYAQLEIISEYEAILYVSSRRIETSEQGGFKNPSIYGVNPGGTSITGIVGTAPTVEEAFQNNNYSFFWENGFYFCSDSTGQKQTGKVLCNRGYGNKWYYFAPAEADYTICNLQGELITMHFPEGAMLYGTWLKEGNYYYYFQADGSMAVSQYIYWNGQSYYMNEMGVYTTW